jgi:hypothetical protein
MLGTISAFAFIHGKTKKNFCADVAGRRTFRILTSSKQSGIIDLIAKSLYMFRVLHFGQMVTLPW